MRIIGIDIGTTTICGLLYDTEARTVLDQLTLPNVQPSNFSGVQDPAYILSSVEAMLERLTENADAIAFSSQMHGILYVDAEGKAVSPFYSWQNQWGKEIEESLSERLGHNVYTGYGIVTHKAMRAVPDDAVRFCNIGDYVVMRLSGRTVPVSDTSIAASMGIWDVPNGKLTEAFPEDVRYFPEVVEASSVLGYWRDIPVITAMGDNQCSFLGSVLSLDEDIVLSYGTSGQISFYSEEKEAFPGFERRPLGKGALQVAFSLTGGQSFQILADFFQEVVSLCGLKLEKPMYRIMDAFEYREEDKGMRCEPFFLGERGNNLSMASFSRITKENFRPKAMTYALMDGIVWELHRFYEGLPEEVKGGKGRLIGTGNGLRMNPHLRAITEEKYGKKLLLSEIKEGSCMGAVMNALVALGEYPSYKDAVKAFAKGHLGS